MTTPSGPEPGAVPRWDDVRVFQQWVIPSDVRYVEHIVGSVRATCAALAFPAHHCSLNVPVAVSEAVSNAILRGNGEDPRKLVRVCATADHHALVLEVTDQGAGFDLERCCIDPTRPAELLRENGRGLFLMRNLMDRVERFDADGNVVRLTLHRK